MKRKSYGISFTFGDLFPKKPGLFSEDIEKEYDEFIRKRKYELKQALASWKRQNSLKNNKNNRKDY